MAQNVTFQHGEKRATDFLNRHLQDIVPEGVYKGFNIRETSTPSFSVDAKAEADGTNVVFTLEGVRIEEDADLPGIATVTTPDAVNPRIDSLFIKHDKTPANDPAIFELLKGLANPSPSAPTPPVDGFFRVKLADILVPANATEITDTEITNAAKTSLGFVPVPFATLSDISLAEANAFNGMAGRGFNEPSAVNSVATILDTNANFLKPAPTSTADDFLQVKGGESWNRRQLSKTTVADTSIQIITAPTTNPRIDLVTYDPDTQTLAIIQGAEAASPVAPVLTDPGLIPVAFILVDEISPASIVVNEADITDARPSPHTKTPEWFDLPDITSNMKDAVTGAVAPAAANVFQTAADVAAAIAPLRVGFALSRLEIDTAKDSTGTLDTDKCRLQASSGQELVITLHNAAFTENIFKVIIADLIVDVTVPAAPGGRDTTASIPTSVWYFVYLIASSTVPGAPPALVLSLDSEFPDLTGVNFGTPNFYDVYRRIGSVRRDSGGLFLESFCKGGICNYLVPGVIESGATMPTSFTPVGAVNPLSDFVPPTSRRVRALAEGVNAGGNTLRMFVAHPDIGLGSSGGKQTVAAFPSVSGGTSNDTNEFETDLDNTQRFHFRGINPGSGSFNIWCVGYVEVL